MRRAIVNAVLLLGVLLLIAANWIVRGDPDRRNVEVLPDMARSAASHSFSENANFSDAMTMRTPPPGTVIRGQMPLPYTASAADAEKAGRELANPVKADAKALARGAAVYAIHCEICHGPAGKGDGTVALRGFPAPPSLLAKNALDLPDGRIFHIITYGQKNMPPYAAQIDVEDRWNAVLHVRAIQRGK